MLQRTCGICNAGICSYIYTQTAAMELHGWKKKLLVTKQVSVDCLGPRVLDRGLGAGESLTGNAKAAWAQLQVNNRESLAN